MKKSILVLSIFVLCSFYVFAGEDLQDFKIAVEESAPVKDVLLATDITTRLTAEGYEFPVGIVQMFNEIDSSELDDKVILAINNGAAVIIVGESVSTDYVKFSTEIEDILEELNIEYKTIVNKELDSDDLSELFFDFYPDKEIDEEALNSLEIVSVSFEPGLFLLNTYEKPTVIVKNNDNTDYLGTFYIKYDGGKENVGGVNVNGIKSGEEKKIIANIITIHGNLENIEFSIGYAGNFYDSYVEDIIINDANCVDTDNSLPNTPSDQSHFIKGTSSDGQDIYYDSCTNFPQMGSLKEYECSDEGKLIGNEYYCENGCNDGMCIIKHECSSNEDCNDDNSCTLDFCNGVPKRECEYTKNNGCESDGNCIPIGTRLDGKFCSLDNILIDFKQKEEECSNDYECESTNCYNSICKPICSGCLNSDNVCLPYGSRIETNYCGLNGIFYMQKIEEEECSNSFECKSGVCVNDECVSQGLIQKVLTWFKSLFS